MAFDPTTATLDRDPDSDSFAEWVKRSSPGVKASARKQASEGIIAAFKARMPADDAVREIMRHSAKVLPLAARKGLRRAYAQAKRAGDVEHLEDYWAANAQKILNEKFTGRGAWRTQAKGWLRSAADQVNRAAGVRGDDEVLTKLRGLVGG
jgi:hypothetical protein